MRAFLFGMVCAVALLVVAIYFVFEHGYVNLGADQRPAAIEARMAMRAVDAWSEKNAGDQRDPLQPTEGNLVAGTTLYLNHCAGCHGLQSNPDSQFRRSFYPPAPGFYLRMADMEDSSNFYVIKHGIRWTGMPAWGTTLNDQQIWQIVLFFNNMHKLPPAAEKVLDAASTGPTGSR